MIFRPSSEELSRRLKKIAEPLPNVNKLNDPISYLDEELKDELRNVGKRTLRLTNPQSLE